MNFYKHHLGDYDAATSHLSWMEDAAYRRLIGVYYRTEKPIPHEDRHRLVRARTAREKEVVDIVLGEFFIKDGCAWRNKRCDEEIEQYQAQANTNRRIARDRPSTKRSRTVVESSQDRAPNHKPEPLTTNQEVISTTIAQSIFPICAGMARALCEKGVKIRSDDPHLSRWVDEGVTIEKALQAVALARNRKPEPEPIYPAYLDAIVRDKRTPAGKEAKPWFLSAAGITAKGGELGIEAGGDFQDFRARVYAAAGVTAEDVSKAQAHWRAAT